MTENKHQEAESAFKRVLKLDPNNKRALSLLIYLYQNNAYSMKELHQLICPKMENEKKPDESDKQPSAMAV